MTAARDDSGSAPRAEAACALRRVLDGGGSLSGALEGLDRRLPSSRDRALARRLSHGVLRDWPAIDRLIAGLLERPLRQRDRVVHFLLAAAIHELRDAREPAPAVVHAAVGAARRLRGRRLTGLVNGVLRRFVRERERLEGAIPDTPVFAFGYPGWLIERIEKDFPDRMRAVLSAGNAPPPLWLRVNRRQGDPAAYVRRLAEAGASARTVAGFPDAVLMAERAAVRRLPDFDRGAVSIQDGAAQLAVEFLDLDDGLRVLDACCAPGGKSAHILERRDVALTAIDVDPERLERVSETLDRLALNADVRQGDACQPSAWWDGEPFDRILVDAPCSGTGVIRRHPDIRWLRRPGDVERLVDLQRRMLDALWPLVAPDGILVYTTCSLLRVENDEQARAFLERHGDARPIEPIESPATPADPGRRLLPGDHDCDGFYYFAARRLRR